MFQLLVYSTITRARTTKLLLPIICFQLTACSGLAEKSTRSLSNHTQNTPELLRQFVREQMKAHSIVGLSVAVLDDESIAFEQGFGYANKAANVSATAHTRYRAGSISKVLTATAIMQLADAKKLDIDAPLVNVLPNFSIQSHEVNAEPITPRMVMTHHAGLPADYMEGMWDDQPAHFMSVLEPLRHEYRTFKPNTVHAYSNLGFTLLGAAVQQVSGMPYEVYMQSHLLAPLYMLDSSFEVAPPTGDTATCAYDEKGQLTSEVGLRDTPAGGLNTSAPDLVRFGSIWFNNTQPNTLLSASSLNEMKTPQNEASLLDADLKVGLGWHFLPNALPEGGVALMHSGATISHHATLLVSPEYKIAVAVMANSAGARQSVDDIAKKALNLYAHNKMGVSHPTSIKAHVYAPASAEQLAGHYVVDGFGLVAIKANKGHLSAVVQGQTMQVKRHPNGYWGLEYKLLGLFPINLGRLNEIELTEANIAEHEVLLAKSSSGFYLAGEKVVPQPIDSIWLGRLGEYQYVGNNKTVASAVNKIALAVNDGFLVANIHADESEQQLALAPINDGQLRISGLGRGRGETVSFYQTNEGMFFKHEGLLFKKSSSSNR